MSDDPALADLVRESLDRLRAHIGDGVDLEDWIADGGDTIRISIAMQSIEDARRLLPVTAAWSYLQGVADALDQTVLEMIWGLGVTIPKVRRRSKTSR